MRRAAPTAPTVVAWLLLPAVVVPLLQLPGCVAGAGDVGSACTEKEQCAGGLCLQAERYDARTGWEDGYCTAPCEETCDLASTCVDLGDQSGQAWCVARCTEDAECRAGYVCNPWWSACLPHCSNEGFSCGALECGDDGHCIDPEVDEGSPDVEPGPDAGVLAGPSELCEGPGSCVAGYVCNPFAGVCLLDCRGQAVDFCPPPEVCAPEGFCHIPPMGPPPPGGPGHGG